MASQKTIAIDNKIKKFMGVDSKELTFITLEKLDSVIDKITALKFSFILSSASGSHICGFVESCEPFMQVQGDKKAKTRLSAVFTAVEAFIDKFDERIQADIADKTYIIN